VKRGVLLLQLLATRGHVQVELIDQPVVRAEVVEAVVQVALDLVVDLRSGVTTGVPAAVESARRDCLSRWIGGANEKK